MPYAAKRPCSYPGCTNLVKNGRCELHQVSVPRIPERQKLYDRKWRRIRAAYLAEHPWCEDCLESGEHTPATDVHHEERHQGDAAVFYSSPLRALCHACHSKRTAEEVGWKK